MYYFNKTKYSTIFLLVFILFITLNGCNSQDIKPKKIKGEVTGAIKKETKVDSFSITISNGGGFTGLKNGYTFNSTGLVKRWRQLSFVKDTTIWKVQTDGVKTNYFKNQLVNSGILKKQYNDTGNITFVLTYQIPDTTYTWSWNGKNGEENAPSEIKNWFKEVTDFIISVQKSK
jgi:hypothetical protein